MSEDSSSTIEATVSRGDTIDTPAEPAAKRQQSRERPAAANKTSVQKAHIAANKKSQPAKWSPLMAILVVVLSYLVAQLAGGFLIAMWPRLHHWTALQADVWVNNSVDAQFFYVLFAEGLTLAVLYWFLRRHRANFRDVGLKRPQPQDIGYAFSGVAAYLVLYGLAIAAVGTFYKVNTSQQQDIGFQHVSGFFALTLTFLSLVVLPPIVEEITFRGVLFTSLRRGRLGFAGAALVTSLLFAAPHLLEGGGSLLWVAGIDTFALSLVLCYLRQRTGRLWAGIGLHAIKNGMAFVTLFVVHFR